MKKIFIACLFLFTNALFASVWESREICFTDRGACYLVGYNKTWATTEWVVYQSGKAPAKQWIDKLKAAGVRVAGGEPKIYNETRSKTIGTTYTTVAQETEKLLQMQEVEFEQWRSVMKCGLGAAGCAGGTFTTIETMGLGFFLAEIACATAAIECSEMIDHLNAWSKAKKDVKAAQKAAAAGGGGHGGGGGDHLTPPPGWNPPGADAGGWSPGGVVTIKDHKD